MQAKGLIQNFPRVLVFLAVLHLPLAVNLVKILGCTWGPPK
jgi:hypothetical protein